jgi:hypothetical protein
MEGWGDYDKNCGRGYSTVALLVDVEAYGEEVYQGRT